MTAARANLEMPDRNLDTPELRSPVAQRAPGDARSRHRHGLGVIEKGALAARAGRIAFVGRGGRPAGEGATATETIDCEGRWITPGLVDCHTHLVYAGDRAQEFELRLKGASYQEIARAGGGIVSTVAATARRARTTLVAADAAAARRADRRRRHDDRDQVGLRARARRRARMLRAAPGASPRSSARSGVEPPSSARTPLPPEFSRRPRRLSPRRGRKDAAGARRRSACRRGRRILRDDRLQPRRDRARLRRRARARIPRQAARRPIVRIAAAPRSPPRFGALSADHLEYTDEAGVAAMAKAGDRRRRCCPAPSTCLREKQVPPIEAVPQARRGDGGGDRLQSRHVAADLAAAGAQHGGDFVPPHRRGMPRRRDPQRRARARARPPKSARSRPGKWADLAIWDIERPAELVYRLGFNPLHARVWRGR